jgi:hypothetical protein
MEMSGNYWGINISKVEEKYNAKYVGDFSINGRDTPTAVFYCENPNRSKGHSNYFGIFATLGVRDNWYICNGDNVLSRTYPAIELPDGELLISTYPHDYKTKDIDGVHYMIDGGGYGYVRCSPAGIDIIQMKVEKDKLIKV